MVFRVDVVHVWLVSCPHPRDENGGDRGRGTVGGSLRKEENTEVHWLVRPEKQKTVQVNLIITHLIIRWIAL